MGRRRLSAAGTREAGSVELRAAYIWKAVVERVGCNALPTYGHAYTARHDTDTVQCYVYISTFSSIVH